MERVGGGVDSGAGRNGGGVLFKIFTFDQKKLIIKYYICFEKQKL